MEQINMRYIHPQEIVLCCGLPPSYVCPCQQLLANLLHQIATQGLIDEVPHPRQIFQSICEELFHERDEIWDGPQTTKYTNILSQEVHNITNPIVYSTPDDLDVYSPCTDQFPVGTAVYRFPEAT